MLTTQPQSQNVIAGNSVTFTVSANGTPAPSYQWRRNSINLSDSGAISGATTASLNIYPTDPVHNGNYDCVVSNIGGWVISDPAALTVYAGASGDANLDGQTNGRDIQLFIGLVMSGGPLGSSRCACGFNGDNQVGTNDMQFFVNALLIE